MERGNLAASPSPLHHLLLLLPPASAGNATGRGGGARAATRGAARENRADSSIPRSLTGAHAARACIGPVQSGWLRCSVKFALLCCPAWTCKVCGHGQLRLKKSPPLETRSPEFNLTQMRSGEGLRKRPSFWVRSERCAVATGDLLLRSNQKTEAVQVTVSVRWTSLA